MAVARRVAAGFLSLLAPAASMRARGGENRHAIVVGFGFPSQGEVGRIGENTERALPGGGVERSLPDVYDDIKLVTLTLKEEAGFPAENIHLITDHPPSSRDMLGRGAWPDEKLAPAEWNQIQREWSARLKEMYWGIDVSYVRTEGQYPRVLQTEERADFEFDNGAEVFWRVAFAVTKRLSDSHHLYLHVVSHGLRVEDNDGDEFDGYDESIYTPAVTDTADVSSNLILDDDVYRWLTMLPPVSMVFVADTDHSGGISDLPYHLMPQARRWCLDRASMGADVAYLPKARVLFLASSHMNQDISNVTNITVEAGPTRARMPVKPMTFTQAIFGHMVRDGFKKWVQARSHELSYLMDAKKAKHGHYIAAYPTLDSDVDLGSDHDGFHFSKFLGMPFEFKQANSGQALDRTFKIRAPKPCTGYGQDIGRFPPAELFSIERQRAGAEYWDAGDPESPQGWVPAGWEYPQPIERQEGPPRPIRRVVASEDQPGPCWCCEEIQVDGADPPCDQSQWGPPCAVGAPC